MDPLAELVKIDPKSIGVGQYQHDVEQGALKKSLDQNGGKLRKLSGGECQYGKQTFAYLYFRTWSDAGPEHC